jgi:hypothetical protein
MSRSQRAARQHYRGSFDETFPEPKAWGVLGRFPPLGQRVGGVRRTFGFARSDSTTRGGIAIPKRALEEGLVQPHGS